MSTRRKSGPFSGRSVAKMKSRAGFIRAERRRDFEACVLRIVIPRCEQQNQSNDGAGNAHAEANIRDEGARSQ